MSLEVEDAMVIINEYYGIQEDLKTMRKLKKSVIEDLNNDLPDYRVEAKRVLDTHDELIQNVDEHILTFSDTTLTAEEHETIGRKLIRKIQQQHIDEMVKWIVFHVKWSVKAKY